MQITCPNCQTSYQVTDDKIPAAGARANCLNCGQIILIRGTSAEEKSPDLLTESSKHDYGQTMAYDFSEVDQSKTEISALLEKISDRKPFFGEGMTPALKEVQSGKEHLFSVPQVTVGRSGTDIIVDDPEVSRRHCRIKVFGDRIVIMDLESTNGTFVQGKKIMTASLGISEQFVLGNTVFEFVDKKAD